jgi:histidine triad (HIT) family protein
MVAAEPADCFVCEKHRLGDRAEGGVLFEDDLMYVGHVHTLAGPTAYRGHLVVEPTRHVPGVGDLHDREAAALGRTCSRMARLLQEAGGAEHVYLYVVGDDVAHLHVHLLPRYPGTPQQHWGPGVTRWPDAPRVDPESMRTLISDLRRRLTTS